MTLYTENGVARSEKIRKDLNPTVRGSQWAKGRYHGLRSETEAVAVSKKQDELIHLSIEIQNLEPSLYADTEIKEDF